MGVQRVVVGLVLKKAYKSAVSWRRDVEVGLCCRALRRDRPLTNRTKPQHVVFLVRVSDPLPTPRRRERAGLTAAVQGLELRVYRDPWPLPGIRGHASQRNLRLPHRFKRRYPGAGLVSVLHVESDGLPHV